MSAQARLSRLAAFFIRRNDPRRIEAIGGPKVEVADKLPKRHGCCGRNRKRGRYGSFSGMEHSATSSTASAWETTPWRAVQRDCGM
jgi:hypothetical protein